MQAALIHFQRLTSLPKQKPDQPLEGQEQARSQHQAEQERDCRDDPGEREQNADRYADLGITVHECHLYDYGLSRPVSQ